MKNRGRMNIVIDEWMIHFISPKESTPEKQKMVFEFLQKVFKKCDKFVTMRGGKLEKKIWWIAKESSNWRPEIRSVVKNFINQFWLNSKKFWLLEENNLIPLSLEVRQKIPEDDLYLIKVAISTKSCILTTDNRLKEKMASQKELSIYLVDEFLKNYDC
ncbi:MAG: hypothetical protein AB1414_01720 [bacterium]